jgi:hypothetical protein
VIQIEDITSKDEMLKRLKQSLEHEQERKKVHTLVRMMLEQCEGKKITKAIEKKIGIVLPGYLVSYFVECYHKKVTIRRRHGGNTEVFSETIMVHSDHFGDLFSMSRFLDNDGKLSAIFARIMELQQMIDSLDETYPAMVNRLIEFITVQQRFREEMSAFHSLAHFMSDSEHEFIRDHTRW